VTGLDVDRVRADFVAHGRVVTNNAAVSTRRAGSRPVNAGLCCSSTAPSWCPAGR
jgi:hypothetical protein